MCELLEQLASSWPIEAWAEQPVVVAVSGGSDSLALALALAELGGGTPGTGRLILAHFHHGLRGREADEDQAAVEGLAQQLGLAIVVGHGHVDHLAREQGDGVEAAARTLRYAFLTATAEAHGARYLVTAHTADDQAETVLHHVLRGTGLRGLRGMGRATQRSAAVTLLRPLLGIRREVLARFLASRGVVAREDSSNADLRYTRNRLRRDLLPKLARDYNPRVIDALLRLAHQAREAEQVLEPLVERVLERALVRRAAQEVTLDCTRLAAEPVYLVRSVFPALWRWQGWPRQALGFAECEALSDLARGTQHAVAEFPGGIVARRAGTWLHLEARGNCRAGTA